MKWYHIKFSESDLSSSTDERLIKEFINLSHQIKQPDGLALYELKFRIEEGKVIYISSPDEVAYRVKSLLAHFPTQEVSQPNLKVLNLILGKSPKLRT
jgi:hypothetical protein